MIFGTASRWREEIKKSVCNLSVVTKETKSVFKEKEPLLQSTTTQQISPYLEIYGVRINFLSTYDETRWAIKELLKQNTLLGLDIETYKLPEFIRDKQAGLDPRKSGIRLVQIYDGEKTVYVFDILKLGGLSVLGLGIWEKPMVAHNAMFELKHLYHNGVFLKRIGCTLLADRVLNGNRIELKESLGLSKSAGLKDLAKELLHLDVSKEMQTSDWSQEVLSNEQIEYAALDAVLVTKIFTYQREQLKKKDLVSVYTLYRDAQHPVACMEINGVGFDVIKHRELTQVWEKKKRELENILQGVIGNEINLNSGKQVSKWLEAFLMAEDLKTWPKTRKGQLSTSMSTYESYEHKYEIFSTFIEYGCITKRISSFGESFYQFIDPKVGRLYGSFSLGSTATGRMASSKPNMQNIPRENFRHLFCAKEGYVLIGLDYSQQELRVAALVSKDPALLHIYEMGEDAHINTAATVLNIPKECVTKEQRQLAKALNFGLLYGQGAKGLMDYAKRNYDVVISLEEAEKLRNKFFTGYNVLRNWQRRTGNLVEITGKTRTKLGRTRDFNREQKSYQFTVALNHPIQGAAAEITLKALVNLFPLLCADCRLVNCIHDEILLEVKESRAQEFSKLAKDIMEQAFLSVFPEAKPYLKGLVDAHIGRNWAETK
jgi:DNA polymerase I